MGNCLVVRKGAEPSITRLKNSMGDTSNSYTFTKKYDYAIVTASQAREGNRGWGISISANNCTITEDSGANYYNISNDRESSIRTYIVKNIVSGSSISVYQQASLVGLSITAIGGD